MKNLLISTIRFCVIAGIALFAFAGEVFAAPVLTPATATTFSATSVTLSAIVFNPVWKNTSVWFEWGEVGTSMITVGLSSVYNEGLFKTRLTNLKPGGTYSFRAVAMDMESKVTVYSPTVLFVTRNGVVNKNYDEAKTVTGTTVVKSTSGNTASVMGTGAGVFPRTLIGLIAFIIALLFTVLFVRMILESNEKRKKAREKAEALRRAVKMLNKNEEATLS